MELAMTPYSRGNKERKEILAVNVARILF